MTRPQIFSRIQKTYQDVSKIRREIAARSNDALSSSKRAIFALHRDDLKLSDQLLESAQEQFEKISVLAKGHRELEQEGTWRAALEEYAEARLFAGYVQTGKFVKLESRASEPFIYLAGLADTTGELVRYATRHVTLGHPEIVKEVQDAVTMVIEFMLDLDLTGYLRTKFDQAKKNLSRLEQMTYDLSIRDRGV